MSESEGSARSPQKKKKGGFMINGQVISDEQREENLVKSKATRDLRKQKTEFLLKKIDKMDEQLQELFDSAIEIAKAEGAKHPLIDENGEDLKVKNVRPLIRGFRARFRALPKEFKKAMKARAESKKKREKKNNFGVPAYIDDSVVKFLVDHAKVIGNAYDVTFEEQEIKKKKKKKGDEEEEKEKPKKKVIAKDEDNKLEAKKTSTPLVAPADEEAVVTLIHAPETNEVAQIAEQYNIDKSPNGISSRQMIPQLFDLYARNAKLARSRKTTVTVKSKKGKKSKRPKIVYFYEPDAVLNDFFAQAYEYLEAEEKAGHGGKRPFDREELVYQDFPRLIKYKIRTKDGIVREKGQKKLTEAQKAKGMKEQGHKLFAPLRKRDNNFLDDPALKQRIAQEYEQVSDTHAYYVEKEKLRRAREKAAQPKKKPGKKAKRSSKK
jgi:hypothetical protein